jgi:ABC-type polysaccharide/polyol phosphate transport system ATPase subunit
MRYAVEAHHLSKEYKRGAVSDTWLLTASVRKLKRWAISAPDQAPLAHELHAPKFALEDVSFAIEPGEVVALLGQNGAGKSTLLRILSRILEPSSGRACVRGRLQGLLDAGAGFERDFSGRENVFLKAAIHGLSARETDRRFERIVAFAGVEDVIDLPVKRYSTGMRNRLGIAVGLHLDHDVLVLDEAFAVVDDPFRERAFAVIREQVRELGVTVLLVSHEVSHLQALCTRGLLLRKGRLALDAELTTSLSALRSSEPAENAASAADSSPI